jgi:hypothetical protein
MTICNGSGIQEDDDVLPDRPRIFENIAPKLWKLGEDILQNIDDSTTRYNSRWCGSLSLESRREFNVWHLSMLPDTDQPMGVSQHAAQAEWKHHRAPLSQVRFPSPDCPIATDSQGFLDERRLRSRAQPIESIPWHRRTKPKCDP